MEERFVKTFGSVLVLFGIFALFVNPGGTQSTSSVSDRKIISDPERLSGVWETRSHSGTVLGLRITLITSVEGKLHTLRDAEQLQEHFNAAVYERRGNEINFGDQNYFSDSPDGGARWDRRHLVLHSLARGQAVPKIDVDLTFDSQKESWTGSFLRGAISEKVTFRRPLPLSPLPANSIIGTWANTGVLDRCLHIVQREDGSLGGWFDTLRLPALMRYANGIKPPTRSEEDYGEIFDIHQVSPGVYSLEFGRASGICCPHDFLVQVSSNGSSLLANRVPGMNQAAGTDNLRRVAAPTCR